MRLARMATRARRRKFATPEKSGAYLVAATQTLWRGRRYPAIQFIESETMKKRKTVRRSPIARDLRTRKYKPRIVPNKKRKARVPSFSNDDGDKP